MPLSLNQLKESGVAPDAYPACGRLGIWEACLDEVAYSLGRRMKTQGKGGRQGIHLYLRSIEDDRKSWLFVMFFPESETYQQAKNLQAGDHVLLETVPGQHGHVVVKSLKKRT